MGDADRCTGELQARPAFPRTNGPPAQFIYVPHAPTLCAIRRLISCTRILWHVQGSVVMAAERASHSFLSP